MKKDVIPPRVSIGSHISRVWMPIGDTVGRIYNLRLLRLRVRAWDILRPVLGTCMRIGSAMMGHHQIIISLPVIR